MTKIDTTTPTVKAIYQHYEDTRADWRRGRFKLVNDRGTLRTRLIDDPGEDIMETVFKDGKLIKFDSYDSIVRRLWNE